MSEQYPLLYESEEERLSARFHRRQPMRRARAKNYVKGAAAIISRWPDHWTTLLSYWWLGIGMIAITTYILYNLLFAFTYVETSIFPHKPLTFKTSILKPSLPPKVFMHIFVDTTNVVDLNNYLPYIYIITNKHKHLKYELIIVANDTNVETKNLSDKENNDLALNMLWEEDFNYKHVLTRNSNLKVEYVTLSKYLNDSPIQKYWKTLPHEFVKFLVRAFSVWESGGIAFDPILLTPQSPHSVYIDKINNMLLKHKTKKEKSRPSHKNLKQYIPSKKIIKFKPKPNNIRDIINSLENKGASEKIYLEPLAEAETKHNFTATFVRKLRPFADTANKEDPNEPMKLKEIQKITADYATIPKNTLNNSITNEKQLENLPKLNLLQLFLNYLFHNQQTSSISEAKQGDNATKDIVNSYENKSLQMKDFWNQIVDRNNYKPMIISAKGILDKSKDNATKLADEIEREVENLIEVTIDLKGNIIATETACHAFVGSMFSDAIHYDKSESLTDFIVKELSVFCKGLLASCVGVDVILL